jgi:hypothetical protein
MSERILASTARPLSTAQALDVMEASGIRPDSAEVVTIYELDENAVRPVSEGIVVVGDPIK